MEKSSPTRWMSDNIFLATVVVGDNIVYSEGEAGYGSGNSRS